MNVNVLDVPRDSFSSQDLIKAQRQLLAAYAQTMVGIKNLPLLIHRPPGNPAKAWWLIGVPKPVVRSLVKRHIRLYAGALGAAFTITAVQSSEESGGERRRAMNEASQECTAIAHITRPHISVANVLAVAATVLGLVGLFYAFPHISSTNLLPALIPILLIISIFGVLPWILYSRSVQYTKKLFRPNDPVVTIVGTTPENPDLNEPLSISEVEGIVLDKTGALRPKNWHESSSMLWLVAIIYATTAACYIFVRWGQVFTLIAVAYVSSFLILFYISKVIGIIKYIIGKVVRSARSVSEVIRY